MAETDRAHAPGKTGGRPIAGLFFSRVLCSISVISYAGWRIGMREKNDWLDHLLGNVFFGWTIKFWRPRTTDEKKDEIICEIVKNKTGNRCFFRGNSQ